MNKLLIVAKISKTSDCSNTVLNQSDLLKNQFKKNNASFVFSPDFNLSDVIVKFHSKKVSVTYCVRNTIEEVLNLKREKFKNIQGFCYCPNSKIDLEFDEYVDRNVNINGTSLCELLENKKGKVLFFEIEEMF